MSPKPGSGGQGGGGKQRPSRPKAPAKGGGARKKPAKPSGPHHPHHHGGASGGRQTHHKHQQAGGAGTGKKRGLSPGTWSCAAEALAQSLRLQGFEVTDHDVLDLYYLTASHPGEGATIEATLAAAAETGLAGVRLASYGPAAAGPGLLGVGVPGPHTVYGDGTGWWSWGRRWRAFADVEERWEVAWGIML